ncbi:hypothetical protein D3C86_2020280 [compost metagenome]
MRYIGITRERIPDYLFNTAAWVALASMDDSFLMEIGPCSQVQNYQKQNPAMRWIEIRGYQRTKPVIRRPIVHRPN